MNGGVLACFPCRNKSGSAFIPRHNPASRLFVDRQELETQALKHALNRKALKPEIIPGIEIS
jgi:hypothetical protein